MSRLSTALRSLLPTRDNLRSDRKCGCKHSSGRFLYRRDLRVEALEDRRLLTVSLGGTVWNDLNSNGIQDTGEAGVAGAVVEVFSSNNPVIGDADDVSRGVAITDASGNYSLSSIPDGLTLYEQFRAPAGFSFTTKDTGADDEKDSDASSVGLTALFTVAAGGTDTTHDAGIVDAAPGFGFAFRAGGSGADLSSAPVIDASGCIYVTGQFMGTVDFDSGPAVCNLTSAGYDDMFVAKYSPTGTLVWARRLGGTSTDHGSHIALANDGSLCIAGLFSGTVDFNPGAGTFNLTGGGGFVLKLDASGNFMWACRAGDGAMNEAVIAADGSVYVSGCFSGTADFDPGPGACLLTSAGNRDAFISKLDSAGNFVWARRMGGTGDDYAEDLAIASDGSVCVVGCFNGTANCDVGAGTFCLTSAGGYDIFLSRIDSAGSFVWASGLGGVGREHCPRVTAAPDGSVYVTGGFEGTVDFDPGAGVLNLTSAGGYDVFVLKLDASDNFVWARRLGGTYGDWCSAVAVGSSGDLCFLWDCYLSRWDSAGNAVWTRVIGNETTYGSGLTTSADGSIYIAGGFIGTADFDPGSGTFNLTSIGNGL